MCFEVDATLSQSPLDPFHRVDLVCGDDARALKLRAMLETCAARRVDVCIITRNSRYLVDRFFGERGLDIMHLVSELRGFEDFDASNASKCDVARAPANALAYADTQLRLQEVATDGRFVLWRKTSAFTREAVDEVFQTLLDTVAEDHAFRKR